MFIIEPANDVSIGVWYGSFHKFLNTFLPVTYYLTNMAHTFLGCLYLLTFTLFCVKVQERKAYVRFWHHHRKGRMSFQSLMFQFLVQYAHSMAHVVPTRSDGIDVGSINGRIEC